MKNAGIITILVLLIFSVSCKNNVSEPDHLHLSEAEDTSSHTHVAEESPSHTHASDQTADTTLPDEEGISHSHEQEQATGSQANIQYKTIRLSKQHFHFVKKTSGRIILDKKGELSIIAQSAGIVRFNKSFLYPGTILEAGNTLFTIEGENLIEDNASLKYANVEADFIKASQDFDRASELIKEKLITQEHYLEKKNTFAKAEAEYKIYKSSSPGGKSNVMAPKPGFIKEILVNEGDKILAGDKLATIQTEDHLVLRADIKPSEFDIIDRINSAKFSTGYSLNVYDTKEMNGRKISYGRSTGDNSFYIPVYFKFDYNKDLIPGTFADIWLIGEDITDAIVIPNSSILEEYGKFYVYIDHGDHFDKRYIIPGYNDGEYTMIPSGLNEDETIVTDGAYQVKMSLLTSIPNTHNHNH